jgi:hypothetical protein
LCSIAAPVDAVSTPDTDVASGGGYISEDIVEAFLSYGLLCAGA